MAYTRTCIKPLMLILCCFLTSCCFRMGCDEAVMDIDVYASFPVGSPIDSLIECAGEPYTICCCPCEPDTYEYIYIERYEIAPDVQEQNHYIIKVSNGVIIDKWMEHYDAPIDFTFGRPLP